MSTSEVALQFSLAVDSDRGSNPANYSLSPAAAITNAGADANTGFVVRLQAALAAGKTCRNLTSLLGTGLDPAHASADFTSPES